MNICLIAAAITIALVMFIVYMPYQHKVVRMRTMYIATHHFTDAKAKQEMIDLNLKLGSRQMKQKLSSEHASCTQVMILSDEDKQVCIWEADGVEYISSLIAPFNKYYKQTMIDELVQCIKL